MWDADSSAWASCSLIGLAAAFADLPSIKLAIRESGLAGPTEKHEIEAGTHFKNQPPEQTVGAMIGSTSHYSVAHVALIDNKLQCAVPRQYPSQPKRLI
jgi:hypothetical protein